MHPGIGHPVGPAHQVGRLRDDPDGDVGVGAEQPEVSTSWKTQRAVGGEAGAHAHLVRGAADRLERLRQRQREPDRPAGAHGEEGEQRLELGVLLAAERPAGVGRDHPHLRDRQAEELRDAGLEQVRVLDRAPDGDAVVLGCGQEDVRLDREVGDHRERVGVLDDAVGARGVDVAPPEVPLAQACSSAPGGRPGGPGPGPAGPPGPAPARRSAPRAAPRRDPHEAAASSAASSVSAATAATGSPWNFVSPTASTGGPGRPARSAASGRADRPR